MTVKKQIIEYINSLPDAKRSDMQALHDLFLATLPSTRLWFLDGRNEENKIVSNPSIGYGTCQLQYANGATKEFYRIGLSANTTGISVYIMGLKDKTYLAKHFGNKIGKASISGYCIKFKAMSDIHTDVLQQVITSIEA